MEKKELTVAQAVRIGALAGTLLIVFLGLVTAIWVTINGGCPFLIECLLSPGLIKVFVVNLPAIPLGVVGALISKKWKNSQPAAWIGAFLGAILGASVYIIIWISLARGYNPFY